MRLRLTLLMLLAVTTPSFASKSVKDKIISWQSGRRIEVTLNSGEKLIGKRGAIQNESFTLESDKPKQAGRDLPFVDVRSANTIFTTGQKWGLAGAVFGALMVMGLVLGK